MKKIGILCAGDTELAPFLEHMKGQQITEKAMLKFHTGTINHVNVSAVYSGVCKVNAAIAAQLLIDMFHVDLIINAGTAGGMKEGVQLFDTVISERVIYHDVADDILTDFHPWLKSNYFPAEPLAEGQNTLFCLEPWLPGSNLLKMKKERKSIRNLIPSPQTWKRPALPMSAM